MCPHAGPISRFSAGEFARVIRAYRIGRGWAPWPKTYWTPTLGVTAGTCYTDLDILTAARSAFRIRLEFPRISCVSSPGIPLGPAIRDSASVEMQEQFMSTKLYVGNLPYQTTESDLQTLFESSGSVASINVVRDRATGQARGFAFVEMSDAESAQRAIKELDRHEYGGRQLTVNEARPMEPRGNDRSGGGGRQRRESRW
jgi:hypothetical protein